LRGNGIKRTIVAYTIVICILTMECNKRVNLVEKLDLDEENSRLLEVKEEEEEEKEEPKKEKPKKKTVKFQEADV
jgi:hypothetical protein